MLVFFNTDNNLELFELKDFRVKVPDTIFWTRLLVLAC